MIFAIIFVVEPLSNPFLSKKFKWFAHLLQAPRIAAMNVTDKILLNYIQRQYFEAATQEK